MSVARAIGRLPGLRLLPGVGTSPVPSFPNPEYSEWLRVYNGAVAFGGALRLFPAQSSGGLLSAGEWNDVSTWREAYGAVASGRQLFFGEDAFGVQFGLSPDSGLVRFWNETGDVEPLGLSLMEFFEVIRDDPDGTVSAGLYARAEEALGHLPLREHFAFKIETALGGEPVVENIARMASVEHMRACGHIAQQIKGMPLGTQVSPKC